VNESEPIELLLVEDNPQDLELTLRPLRKANVLNRVHVARDGVEALEFIFCEGPHAARRISDRPKVILLDLKLPKIDGLEVLKRVRDDARTKMIPIIMLTSSKKEADVIKSDQFGANGYIVKPVNFERLAETARSLGLYWAVRDVSIMTSLNGLTGWSRVGGRSRR
jgi:two-component system response regulator